MSSVSRLVDDPLFAETSACLALKQQPLGFIDIGARGGVHPLVEPLAELTAVLAFEPDAQECQRIREKASQSRWAAFAVEPIALAQTAGEVLLHLVTKPINCSLRPPNTDLIQRYNMVGFEPIGTIPVQTISLDEVVFGNRNGPERWGEFIKLDTQGTELEILQGGQRTLAERTVAIYIEVEFCQLYEGQKLFSEVELFLRERGFTFHGFASIFQRSRKLPPQLDKRREAWRERALHADAVFFKDPLPGGASLGQLSQRGNFALFACALLLGYYDFALELALNTWATGTEADRIEKLVRRRAEIPVDQTVEQVLKLAERIRAKPEDANIEVGRFVDERRDRCDYNDVPRSM